MSDVATETQPTTPATPAPVDWKQYVPEDLRSDTSFAPTITSMSEKIKDLPSLVKSYAHLERKLGSAVNFPDKNAKPEDVTSFKEKIYGTGLFHKPPTSTDSYDFQFPATFVADDNLVKETRDILLKHGVTPEVAKELGPVYARSVENILKVTDVNPEDGVAKLKAKYGDKYQQLTESAGRFLDKVFKDNPAGYEKWKAFGLANDPEVMIPFYELAPFAEADTSFLQEQVATKPEVAQQALAEHTAIVTDPKNPKHELYLRNDPATIEYIDGLYKKAYGSNKL